MTEFATDLQRKVIDAPAHRVYARALWQDAWTEVPYLYCAEVQFALAPSIPSATLVYFYGQILQPDKTAHEEYSRLSLPDRCFVKVEIDQPDMPVESGPPEEQPPIVWYGRVHTDVDRPMGEVAGMIGEDLARTPTGLQMLQCYGLELDLDWRPVTTAWVRKGGVDVEIGRTIAFNRGGGNRRTDNLATDLELGKNMSNTNGDKVARLFADRLDGDAEQWNTDDIVLYLLKYHGPKTSYDDDVYGEIDFDPESQIEWLQWQKPTLDPHGKTVRALLNELIDRRRLVSWCLKVANDDGNGGGDLQLSVWSFNEEPIDLEDISLTANPFQLSLDFEEALNVIDPQIDRVQLDTYHQVVVTGARRTSTFTIDIYSGLLTRHYQDDDLINGYNEAFSTDATYATLELEEQQRKNAEVRAEERFDRVYSYFGLIDNWDGLTIEDDRVCPKLGNFGEIVPVGDDEISGDQEPFWQPGMRFLHELPLKELHDYSGDKIENGEVTNTLPEGQIPDYRSMLLYLEFDVDGEEEDRVVRADRVGEDFGSEKEDDGGRSWSCSVRPRADTAGIVVRVAGAAQHKIDPDNFVALDEDVELADEKLTNIGATVCWECDCYAEVRYPLDDGIDVIHDVLRQLRIDLGDDYRLDYVAPNTVVQIEKGAKVTSNGGFVRDDRPRMRAVAQVAFNWYSKPRRAIRLPYRGILRSADLGTLITQIGREADAIIVNTVVTAVGYNLVEQVSTLETDFAELDAGGFLT
jgi:hypothetical protein